MQYKVTRKWQNFDIKKNLEKKSRSHSPKPLRNGEKVARIAYFGTSILGTRQISLKQK